MPSSSLLDELNSLHFITESISVSFSETTEARDSNKTRKACLYRLDPKGLLPLSKRKEKFLKRNINQYWNGKKSLTS